LALHLAKTDVGLYLRNKRLAKRKRRTHRLQRHVERDGRRAEAYGTAFGRVSRIIDMMAGAARSSRIEHRGHLRYSLPSKFSVIGNASETLNGIFTLASEMRRGGLKHIFMDLRRLSEYDLSANGLLNVLVDEFSVQNRLQGRKIYWRGNFPEDRALARFFVAMGFIKRLKIKSLPEVSERLAVFDKRCKHFLKLLRPRQADRKSLVTREFADHLDTCLGSIGRELTVEAKSRLCQYVGEVLDNAEQHSGMQDWAIQGYLDTSLDIPMCEVTIFNFGRSIAQTFHSLKSDSYPRRQVQKYVDLHRRRRLFGKAWDVDALYTLVSLQGNVSTKNASEEDTRGNGTVDLIEFFQRMHDECSIDLDSFARMTIVSGNTSILFDGTYKMSPNEDGISIIAFNEANDLRQPPDPKYVGKLEGVAFPGTLIGLKFPLATRSTLPATAVPS
jgi:hypothetical protein